MSLPKNSSSDLQIHLKLPPKLGKRRGPGQRDVYVDDKKVGEVWKDGGGWAWHTPATGCGGDGLATRAEAVDAILIVN